MKTILTILFFLCIGFTQAQNTGYGAGRPKKGPVLPSVAEQAGDTIKNPKHKKLKIVVDFVVIGEDYLSGIKVAEIHGDTTDKVYINNCIIEVFDGIRKKYPAESPGKNNVKVKFRQPVVIPANNKE